MKKIVVYILSVILLSACAKDPIDRYGETEYIFFANPSAQVLEYSFAFNPGASTDTIPVIFRLIGKPASEDRVINVVVDQQHSDAASSDYTLPSQFVLKAGAVRDTVPLIVHNSSKLTEQKVKLRLVIQENSHFQVGPTTNAFLDVLFSDIIARPSWWNNIVTNNFLGAYSDAKYRLFIEATGIADMGGLSENEQRAYAIIFRDYLARGREQGEEYKEADGSLIQVSPNLS